MTLSAAAAAEKRDAWAHGFRNQVVSLSQVRILFMKKAGLAGLKITNPTVFSECMATQAFEGGVIGRMMEEQNNVHGRLNTCDDCYAC